MRSPPSLPQQEEECVGEAADIVSPPRLAGACIGKASAAAPFVPFDDGEGPPLWKLFEDPPNSQSLPREEAMALLLGDGIEGRRWRRGPFTIPRGGCSTEVLQKGSQLVLLETPTPGTVVH